MGDEARRGGVSDLRFRPGCCGEVLDAVRVARRVILGNHFGVRGGVSLRVRFSWVVRDPENKQRNVLKLFLIDCI